MGKEKQQTTVGTQARELFIALALALDVKHADSLTIGVSELQSSTTLTVQAHADDHGKLVGSGGVMINALKSLFALVGNKQGVRVRVVLNHPKPGEIGPRPRFQAATNWNNEPIRLLAEKVSAAIFSRPFTVKAADAGETTTLEIVADDSDPALSSANVIESAFATIFHAVGKTQGRNEVFVDLATVTV